MFAIVALVLLVGRAEAQKAKPVTIENLVTAHPVPEGYAVSLNELKDGEKLLGHQLVFSTDGAVSKVLVTVEDRKLPDKAHKITALKGYINGTAKSLAAAGLKLVKKDIPDIEKVNVDKPPSAASPIRRLRVVTSSPKCRSCSPMLATTSWSSPTTKVTTRHLEMGGNNPTGEKGIKEVAAAADYPICPGHPCFVPGRRLSFGHRAFALRGIIG